MATNTVQDVVGEQASIFQSNLPLREKLDRARTELLDLSPRKSTSSQLRTLIGDVVTAAMAKGWLDRKNGMLVTGAEAPGASTPVDVPSPLVALIAEGEHERLEFKEAPHVFASASPSMKEPRCAGST